MEYQNANLRRTLPWTKSIGNGFLDVADYRLEVHAETLFLLWIRASRIRVGYYIQWRVCDYILGSARIAWVSLNPFDSHTQNTYSRGVLRVGAVDGVAAAGAPDGLGGVAVEFFFVPAIAPPIMAAATTMPRIIANKIQKILRRMPHILRGPGSGGVTGTTFIFDIVFESES